MSYDTSQHAYAAIYVSVDNGNEVVAHLLYLCLITRAIHQLIYQIAIPSNLILYIAEIRSQVMFSFMFLLCSWGAASFFPPWRAASFCLRRAVSSMFIPAISGFISLQV